MTVTGFLHCTLRQSVHEKKVILYRKMHEKKCISFVSVEKTS